ncbi:MAG: hypothetical protein IPP68_00925 [Elusimicrobia bacterium]|nr:hypothetical protein [Elusimicrobiota bacterium]
MNAQTLRRSLAAAGVLLAGVSGVRAAFRDPLWSARAAALGGAFTALGDDPTAAFYNPAATTEMKSPAANFTYAKLFTGLDEVNVSLSQFAYVRPLKSFNVLSVGWGSVSASNLRREDTVTFGAAHLFRDLGDIGNLAVGVSGRLLSQSFTLDNRTSSDPVFRDGRTRNDFALDVHIHLAEVDALSRNMALGLSVRGINRPDIGFASKDKLPMEAVLGLAYRWRNCTLPLDIVQRGSNVTPEAGVEARFAADHLALRMGSDTHSIGTGLGYRYERPTGLVLSFDYAFLWPLNIQGTSGSHRATLGVRF